MRIGNYINPKFTEWTGIETTFYKGYPYTNQSSEDDRFFPAPAMELKVDQSTYIQCSQSLSGLSIIKVYGEDNNDKGIGPNQLSLDTINDRIYNNHTQDIKVSRIDLSDGTKLVYMGGLDIDGSNIVSTFMRDSNQISGNDATISGTISYVTQKLYNHQILFGSSQNRVLNWNSNLTLNSREVSDTLANHNMSAVYEDTNGTLVYYYAGIQTDGTDTNTAITDPEGQNQEITTINGEFVLNSYADYDDADVSPIAGLSTLLVIADVAANDLYVEVEIKSGSISSYGFRDETLSDLFIEQIEAYYGTGTGGILVRNQMDKVDDFWNALNGGVDQGGDCPNGIDDDYPNTTLGINTVNGFNFDATSTKFREILQNVLTEATVQNFLESTRTDGFHTSTTWNWEYTLIKRYTETLSWTTGTNILDKRIENFLAIGSLNTGNTFFTTWERNLEKIQVFIFSTTKTGVHWYRWRKFIINDKEILPCLVDGTSRDVTGEVSTTPIGTVKKEKRYNLNTGNWIASREHRANSGVSGMYVKVNSITYSTTSTKDERLNVPFYLATVSTVDINWSWQSSGNSEIYNLLLEGPYNNSQEPSPYNNNIYITNSLTNGDMFSYNDNIPSQWGFQISPTYNYGGLGFKWVGGATYSQILSGKVRYTEPFLWESEDKWSLNHVNNYLEWKDFYDSTYNIHYIALTQSEGETYYGELSWNENEYTLDVRTNYNRDSVRNVLISKYNNSVNYITSYQNKLIANSTQKFNEKLYTVPTDMKIFLDPSNKYSYPGSGTTWYDISGNDNDFTANGNVSHNGLTTIYDDSVDSYLLGSSITFTDVSISFFFKITGNPNNNANFLYLPGTVLEFISLNRLSLVNGKYTYRLQYAFEESTTWYYADTTLVQDRWYNLTLVYNHTTTTLKFYLNGVVDMTSTPRSDYRGGTGTLRIGYNPDYSLVRGYNGEMGIFMYFDRVLTESEISNIYNLYKGKYIK